jgi:hypothetical protein
VRAVRHPSWALVVLLGGYLLARVRILAGGTVFTSYDTFSYAYRDDPAFDRGALVSLTGHAPRLFGVPLFYVLFPDDRLRAAGQWALGTLAWAVLAWVLWTCLRSLAAKLLAAGGVLVLALTGTVSSWDFAILSESLSISLGVLTLALLLRWLVSGSRPALAGMVAGAVWWTFTRPDIRVFVVLVVGVLAVVAWRRAAWRRAALVAAGVLAIAVAWCTALVPVVDRSYQRWSATPQVRYDEGLLVYRLRLHVLPDPRVKRVFQDEFGMPSCAAAEDIARGSAWRTVDFVAAYVSCPQLRAWGQENAGTVFYRFAREEPGLYGRYLQEPVSWSLGGAAYAKVPRPLPAKVERLAFPPWRYSIPFLAAAVLVAGMAAVLAGAARRRTVLFWTGLLLAGFCAVSAVAGVVFGAGEYNRFGVQEAAGLRLAPLVLACAALDSALERRADRSRQPRPAEEPAVASA